MRFPVFHKRSSDNFSKHLVQISVHNWEGMYLLRGIKQIWKYCLENLIRMKFWLEKLKGRDYLKRPRHRYGK